MTVYAVLHPKTSGLGCSLCLERIVYVYLVFTLRPEILKAELNFLVDVTKLTSVPETINVVYSLNSRCPEVYAVK